MAMSQRVTSGQAHVSAPNRKCMSKRFRTGKLLVRSQQNDEGGKDSKSVNPQQKKVLEELKKKGMTPQKAQELLKVWRNLGASDAEQLKQLLVKRSLQPLNALVIQALFDGAASVSGFLTGSLANQSSEFQGQIVVMIFGYFLGFYYFLQCMFELSAITTIIIAASKYRTNTTALLAAVQQLAGPQSSFSVVNKAQFAVNTVKVLQSLDAVMTVLKDEYGSTVSDSTTLQNLSAYLTLLRAEQLYGFQPEKYGLSEREAADIALIFARFDFNDDGKLEEYEISQLLASQGQDLNDAEVKEALKVLDTSKNGYVEFGEFVDWWVKNCFACNVAPF